jgi:REP element-mobilizing transposase RayT
MPHSEFNPQKHHRGSIRLPNYDYSQPGGYFVTIVTQHRECLFGDVIDGEMKLNKVGEIVRWEWLELPKRFHFIELGMFVVMPNHFHGILIFHENVGATHQSSPPSSDGKVHLLNQPELDRDGSSLPNGPQPASLGAVMSQFKSRVTKRLSKMLSLQGKLIWQRNYYEHIIRNEKDLRNKTEYIEANPMLWSQGEENPANNRP